MEPAPDFDAGLAAGEVVLRNRDRELLAAVDREGALSRAADTLDRSYAHAQRRIVELEDAFGPLVERQRGGNQGGGSELTDRARRLLAAFERLQAEFTGVAETAETVLRGDVIERNGELATVDTAAGQIRAVTPTDATSVDVTIRADTVTLGDAADPPEDDETSARNRFVGTVSRVESGDALARITVDVAPDVSLLALVTTDSVETLELTPGVEVVASFKATATRAVAPDEA